MAFGIFGCPHKRLSFPMVTSEPRLGSHHARWAPQPKPRAHVTCLDCGREFWYDWTKMRRSEERPRPGYLPRRAA